MDHVETEGDSIDKAIENARIRATLRKSAIDLRASELESAPVEERPVLGAEATAMGQKAKEVLAEILNLMGISAEVELRLGEKTGETVVEIRAENSGLLIGRKGQTLEALQYLVSRIAGERAGTDAPHIVVDIENYRQRRRKALEDMALRLGEKAKRQRMTVTVYALSAA